LARGELHCVGATTLDELSQACREGRALARRFQPVFVSEPTVETRCSILRASRRSMSSTTRWFTDAAIVAPPRCSNRYITDRFLPDKAIDLIDERGAPAHAGGFQARGARRDHRRVVQLKIEQER